MSYARFSYADVYVFLNAYGYLDCCGCWLKEDGRFTTTAGMLEHLAKHKAAGHNVPDETIEGLTEDAAENDAWIANVEAGMCHTCDGSGVCPQPHPDYMGRGCPCCKDTKVCYSCNGLGGNAEWVKAHPKEVAP